MSLVSSTILKRASQQVQNSTATGIATLRVHLIRMKFVLFVLNGSYPDPTK